MDDKNPMTNDNAVVKSEPLSPKKILLASSLIPPHAIKTERSGRLPEFRLPRDLTLSGSTSQAISTIKSTYNSSNKASKKTYAPNVNVVRRKGSGAGNDSHAQTQPKSKGKEWIKKEANNKKRNANLVQTHGVFSEGPAPGKVKAFRSSYAERAQSQGVMERPKLNLNQKIVKKNEDSKLQLLLKDDFIDDPSCIPDLTFNPSSLPKVYNVRSKTPNTPDLEKTFESLQVKMEKISNINFEDMKQDKSDVLPIFEENNTRKLLLFQFPGLPPDKEDPSERKKPSKNLPVEAETKPKVKPGSLASLGEGHWGCLRVHENGNTYFVVGKNTIPVLQTRHLTRQEVVAATIDSHKSKGEVINLGTIDAAFTCTTNFFQDRS